MNFDRLKKYKADIILLAIFSLFYFFVLAFMFGRYGSLMNDCGREVFVPSLILEGKVLFKEVFSMYNPLSYQINAIFYFLFGKSLYTLYYAGIVNAYIMLLGVYFCARIFVKPKFCFGLIFFISCFFVLEPSLCMNYIFPYAYAFAYALTCFVYFVLFFILWLKTAPENWIIQLCVSLMLGLSAAYKIEYALCVIPFVIFLVYKKINLRLLFFNMLAIILPSALSWGILFLQGLNISDVVSYLEFLKRTINSQEYIHYSKVYLASVQYLNIHYKSILVLAAISLLLTVINTVCISTCLQRERGLIKNTIKYIVFIVVCFYLTPMAVFRFEYSLFSYTLFSAAVFSLYFLIKNKDDALLLFMLTVFAFCTSIRCGFFFINDYSIFMAVVPLLLNFIFIYKLSLSEKIQNAFLVFLIFISIFNICYRVKDSYYRHNLKLNTTKGYIYESEAVVDCNKKAIDWINQNTKSTDTVLILPEGPFLNFITDRQTNNMYYQLIPNHIAGFGEDNIVKQLAQNPPDYIIVNLLDYSAYGTKTFGINFGLKIAEFIISNYTFTKKITTDYNSQVMFVIYKKNKFHIVN